LALVFSRKQRSVKLGFNLAQFLLCSVVTVGVVHVLVGVTASFGPRDWPTAFLATSAENMVGVFAVTAAISLAEGTPQHARVPRMLIMGSVVSLTNTSLALLVITVLFVEPAAALLFAVPIIAVFVAYRAYVSEREQHEGLEMLYESTRILQRSPQIDRALVSLLDHARKMFRAEIAEVSLLPQLEGQEILRTRVGPGDAIDMMQPSAEQARRLLDCHRVARRGMLMKMRAVIAAQRFVAIVISPSSYQVPPANDARRPATAVAGA
jgi:hypothetical protein